MCCRQSGLISCFCKFLFSMLNMFDKRHTIPLLLHLWFKYIVVVNSRKTYTKSVSFPLLQLCFEVTESRIRQEAA